MIVVVFSSMLGSCNKVNYGPGPSLEENQSAVEEKEALLANEMLEREGLRLFIKSPPGSADMKFRLFKASPNRSEIKIGIIKESSEYYILSKLLSNNTDFILQVEYNTVAKDGAFQVSVNGILSLKGPAGLNLPDYSYTTGSAGVIREVLRIRKGSLKFSFFPL